MLWYGESAGTTTRLYSSTARAIGVTSDSCGPAPRAAWVAMCPVPPTIRLFGSSSVLSWPRPMVPPAPGMFTTCTLFTRPFTRIACWSSRWNESQPPPAAAGAIRVRLVRTSVPPEAEPMENALATMTVITATTENRRRPRPPRRGGSAVEEEGMLGSF